MGAYLVFERTNHLLYSRIRYGWLPVRLQRVEAFQDQVEHEHLPTISIKPLVYGTLGHRIADDLEHVLRVRVMGDGAPKRERFRSLGLQRCEEMLLRPQAVGV